jgi:hypothetical protein
MWKKEFSNIANAYREGMKDNELEIPTAIRPNEEEALGTDRLSLVELQNTNSKVATRMLPLIKLLVG